MIAVIDYGLGNIRSVSKALESVGAKVEVTNKASVISKADGIVLPGVGAFCKGIENLRRLKLISAISESVGKDKPLLGICLGLQLLFSKSYEHGTHRGLDIIKGSVKKFPESVKIPHMGWNNVNLKLKTKNLKLFKGIPDNSYFYFVHSYFVEPADKDVIAGTTEYGRNFCSAIEKDNVFGVQFHPEKSSQIGLKILENFVKICR